jgi:hypothetical protein
MSAMSRPSAIEAYLTDTMNVMENAPIMPISDVCHVKYLKVGLQRETH